MTARGLDWAEAERMVAGTPAGDFWKRQPRDPHSGRWVDMAADLDKIAGEIQQANLAHHIGKGTFTMGAQLHPAAHHVGEAASLVREGERRKAAKHLRKAQKHLQGATHRDVGKHAKALEAAKDTPGLAEAGAEFGKRLFAELRKPPTGGSAYIPESAAAREYRKGIAKLAASRWSHDGLEERLGAYRAGGFDPKEPREPHTGKWTAGPGAGGIAAAKGFLDAHYGEWRRKLSPAQDKGMRFYQSPGFALMNGQLRGLDAGKLKASEHASDSDLERARTATKNLVAAIRKAPPLPHDMTAYRGMDPGQFGTLTVGQVISDPAFVSTSLTPGAGAVGRAARSAEAKVHLPAGTKAAAGSARELVLPPGSHFRVISVRPLELELTAEAARFDPKEPRDPQSGKWVEAFAGAGLLHKIGGLLGETAPGEHPASPNVTAAATHAAGAVTRMIGGHQSYDGQVSVGRELRAGTPQAGAMAFLGWDGSLHLQSDVARQLDTLDDGGPVAEPDALIALEHEFIHGLAEPDPDDPATYAGSQAAAAVEEGFTQLGATLHAGEFFDRLGVAGRATPGGPAMGELAAQRATREAITGRRAWGSYPTATRGAYLWAEDVAKSEGTPPARMAARVAEITDEMNRLGVAGKWGRVLALTKLHGLHWQGTPEAKRAALPADEAQQIMDWAWQAPAVNAAEAVTRIGALARAHPRDRAVADAALMIARLAAAGGQAARFDPHERRIPKGMPNAGQWVKGAHPGGTAFGPSRLPSGRPPPLKSGRPRPGDLVNEIWGPPTAPLQEVRGVKGNRVKLADGRWLDASEVTVIGQHHLGGKNPHLAAAAEVAAALKDSRLGTVSGEELMAAYPPFGAESPETYRRHLAELIGGPSVAGAREGVVLTLLSQRDKNRAPSRPPRVGGAPGWLPGDLVDYQGSKYTVAHVRPDFTVELAHYPGGTPRPGWVDPDELHFTSPGAPGPSPLGHVAVGDRVQIVTPAGHEHSARVPGAGSVGTVTAVTGRHPNEVAWVHGHPVPVSHLRKASPDMSAVFGPSKLSGGTVGAPGFGIKPHGVQVGDRVEVHPDYLLPGRTPGTALAVEAVTPDGQSALVHDAGWVPLRDMRFPARFGLLPHEVRQGDMVEINPDVLPTGRKLFANKPRKVLGVFGADAEIRGVGKVPLSGLRKPVAGPRKPPPEPGTIPSLPGDGAPGMPSPSEIGREAETGRGAIFPDERKLASSVDTGIKNEHPVGEQGAMAKTNIVQLGDSSKAIHKIPYSSSDNDNEYLSSLTAEAIGGTGAPPVIYGDRDTGDVYMGFVDGTPAFDYDGPGGGWDASGSQEAYQNTRSWRIGLLDALIDNGDRHQGNYMWSPERGGWVPIDHGITFVNDYGVGNASPSTYGPFYDSLQNAINAGGTPIPDIDAIRGRLERLEPAFAAEGHQSWYDGLIARLHTVERWQADHSTQGVFRAELSRLAGHHVPGTPYHYKHGWIPVAPYFKRPGDLAPGDVVEFRGHKHLVLPTPSWSGGLTGLGSHARPSARRPNRESGVFLQPLPVLSQFIHPSQVKGYTTAVGTPGPHKLAGRVRGGKWDIGRDVKAGDSLVDGNGDRGTVAGVSNDGKWVAAQWDRTHEGGRNRREIINREAGTADYVWYQQHETAGVGQDWIRVVNGGVPRGSPTYAGGPAAPELRTPRQAGPLTQLDAADVAASALRKRGVDVLAAEVLAGVPPHTGEQMGDYRKRLLAMPSNDVLAAINKPGVRPSSHLEAAGKFAKQIATLAEGGQRVKGASRIHREFPPRAGESPSAYQQRLWGLPFGGFVTGTGGTVPGRSPAVSARPRLPMARDDVYAKEMANRIGVEQNATVAPDEVLKAVPPLEGESPAAYGQRLAAAGGSAVLRQVQEGRARPGGLVTPLAGGFGPVHPRELAPEGSNRVKVSGKAFPDQVSLQHALDGGISREWDSGASGAQAETTFVQASDGTKAVHKAFYSWDQGGDFSPTDMADAEYLTAQVGEAIGGTGVPPVVRGTDPGEIYMGFVDGETAENYLPEQELDPWYPDTSDPMFATPQARRIGLMDYLADNTDRHAQNYMFSGGEPVPIDNSSTWGIEGGGYTGPFRDSLMEALGGGEHPIPAKDLAEIGKHLEAIKPQFDAAGRQDWYRSMMRRFHTVQRAERVGYM